MAQALPGRAARALANIDEDGNVIDKNKPAKRYADNIDALVYMVLVDAGVTSDPMRDDLYNDRTQARRLLLWRCTASRSTSSRKSEKLAMVVRNIGQYVVEDDENQTAYLNLPQSIWWYWYGSEYEANAYYLKLLVGHGSEERPSPRSW